MMSALCLYHYKRLCIIPDDSQVGAVEIVTLKRATQLVKPFFHSRERENAEHKAFSVRRNGVFVIYGRLVINQVTIRYLCIYIICVGKYVERCGENNCSARSQNANTFFLT